MANFDKRDIKDENMIQFTEDNDYEDGTWINGEFFGKKKKHSGQKMSKKEALYGVFYENENENENKDNKKGNNNTMMSFVKAEGDDYDSSDNDDYGHGHAGNSNSGGIGGGIGSNEHDDDNEDVGSNDNNNNNNNNNSQELTGKFAHLLSSAKLIKKRNNNANNNTEPIAEEREGEQETTTTTTTTRNETSNTGNQDYFRNLIQENEKKQKMVNEEEERLKAKRIRETKLDRNFASFENATRGIGMKLLNKWSEGGKFTGRLGKDQRGVTRAMEVKLRPQTMGLGYNNFKEAAAMKINKEIASDFTGKELTPESDEDEDMDEKRVGKNRNKPHQRNNKNKAANKAEEMVKEANWKGGKNKKKRYITVDEILARQQRLNGLDGTIIENKKEVIIDMRGPQKKILSDMDEINYEMEDIDAKDLAKKPELGAELLHNVSLLIDKAEGDVCDADQKLKLEKRKSLTTKNEYDDLNCRVEKSEDRLNRLATCYEILTRVSTKLSSDAASITHKAVLGVFSKLQNEFAEEYHLFEISQLAPAMIIPVLNKQLEDWDPLSSDTDFIISILEDWKSCLTSLSGSEDNHDRNDMQIPWSSSTKSKSMQSIEFNYIVSESLIPILRNAWISRWEVRNVEACIKMFEQMQPIISKQVSEELLRTIIFPKLARALDQWNPREDPIPVHTWIFPWLPYLKTELVALFPNIRRKMKQVLKEWHPSDESAYLILKPWYKVFDKKGMDDIIKTSIVPKLVKEIQEMTIDPSNQKIEPFQYLIKWCDLIPSIYLICILEAEFFPKWILTLYNWMNSENPNYVEISKWYMGWKNIFPEEIKIESHIILKFHEALQMMQHFLAIKSSKEEKNKQSSNIIITSPAETVGKVSYLYLLEQRRQEAAYIRQQQQQQIDKEVKAKKKENLTKQMNSISTDYSFRDVVENFAQRNNIEFLPRYGKFYEGKQIYNFGDIYCYIDRDVLFAELNGTGKGWTGISLETLLQNVKNK